MAKIEMSRIGLSKYVWNEWISYDPKWEIKNSQIEASEKGPNIKALRGFGDTVLVFVRSLWWQHSKNISHFS